ncbi:uncharacterized protein K460DRAFT_359932 [Cucurbitaria berberidis CBS 394.84]|uniref:RanBP2-type domain-containing protein n=1 Tax=Cucurbitaria berberidis CBS 394.84 TaxID=1168544 RepID=A0A9P4G745_9PLEO|nr:uncharacterized protein K460DRAFT_359932 [Cucurbitaria berberidis CBS 394.84]KAF1840224.1 hypothetical protein K460DRAFT_359932 [Cucurbitaria berberidis CBS 394.84]
MSRVPADMWICGSCKGGNLIALTGTSCPVCGHQRDSCCIGPGEIYSDNTEFSRGQSDSQPPCPTAPSFHTNGTAFHAHLADAGRLPHVAAPSTNHSTSEYEAEYDQYPSWPELKTSIPLTNCPGGGTPAPGSWICQQCGAANSDLTPEFCPICGSGR